MKGDAANKSTNYAKTTLPIVFVLDTSGTMQGYSIDVLNTCLDETIKTIGSIAASNYDVIPKIGILQIHSGAHWINLNRLEAAENFVYRPLIAGGLRDMGAALAELNEKLSRKAFLISTSKKCIPIIIFMICGQITDSWYKPLYDLQTKNIWYQKSVKIAFALGEEADIKALSDTVGDSGVVIKTNGSYTTFGEIFKDIVISAFNNSWIYHIMDYFHEDKKIKNIVQDILAGCDLNTEVKATVLWGSSVVEVISSGKEDSEYNVESAD